MIWLLMILFSTSLDTSPHIIKGLVQDDTGEPVLFGNVVVYKNGIQVTGTQTDLEGLFHIYNLSPGVCTLEASYNGLQSKRIPISLIKNEAISPITFVLEKRPLLEKANEAEYEVPPNNGDNTSKSGIDEKEKNKNLPIEQIKSFLEMVILVYGEWKEATRK